MYPPYCGTIIQIIAMSEGTSSEDSPGYLRRKRKRDEMHQSDPFGMSKKCKDQEPCEPTTDGSCMVRNTIALLREFRF